MVLPTVVDPQQSTLKLSLSLRCHETVTARLLGSPQVNQATMFWDDGAEQNVYSVNNQYSSTRFGIRGKAKIGGGWSAGYQIEA